MRLVALLIALAACGDNVIAPPDAAVSPAPALERCAELSCAFTICGSCPACGEPETTCECYQAATPGQDDPHVPCAP